MDVADSANCAAYSISATPDETLDLGERMSRYLLALSVAAAALALCANAVAGSYSYYSSPGWVAGQGASSSFSSAWMQDFMVKNAPFDSTIAFIDNVSYSWHSTLRGPGTYLETHWFASDVKKGHCRANVASNAWAACSVKG